LIIESSTHFGIEAEFFNSSDLGDSEELMTSIEWKVKSGHELELVDFLKKSHLFKDEAYFINGNMDIVLEEKNAEKFISNIDIYRNILNKQNNERETTIWNFIKKIRTTVRHRIKEEHEPCKQPIYDFLSRLSKKRHFLFSIGEINEISDKLMALNVSSHIKRKIIKCYYAVNLGLNDSVLFASFIDFIPWLRELRLFILETKDKFNLADFENILLGYITVFDSAYRHRAYNSYLFEDFYDANIQYNASIQELVSVYNSNIHLLSRMYFKPEGKSTNVLYPRFLVNSNLTNTSANYIAINFHIHDFHAPEFIFTTLHKEIFNSYIHHKKLIKSEIITVISKRIENVYFQEKKDNTDLDCFNILNDLWRFLLTFNWDFELYYYWFWSFNIQNTQLYNSKGRISEERLIHELIRFISIKTIYENYEQREIIQAECPVNDFFPVWARHYNGIETFLATIFTKDVCRKIVEEQFNDSKLNLINIKDIHFTECKLSSDKNWNSGSQLLMSTWKARERHLFYDKCKKYYFKSFKNQDDNNNIFKFYYELKKYMSLELSCELFMFLYLSELKELQENKIANIPRHPETGYPLSEWIKNNTNFSNITFLLDSKGGIFIHNNPLKYFMFRNNTLDIFRDISWRWKYEYLVEKNVI